MSKNKVFSEEELKEREASRQRKREETERRKSELFEDLKRGEDNKRKAEEAVKRLAKKKDSDYSYHIMFGVLGALVLYIVIMAFVSQAPNINKVLVIDDSQIDSHNSFSEWKQKGSNFFEGATLADAKKLFQVGFSNHNNLNQCHQDDTITPPESFFYKEQWPQCSLPVQDTGKNCGSSFAFTLSQTYSERICIAEGKQSANLLSAQDLLTCDVMNNGCKGGYLNNSLDYIVSKGLVTDKCYGYNPESTECQGLCDDQTRSRADSYCLLVGETEIKRDIMKNGPVVSTITVFVDFLTYSSGVYVKGDEVAKFQGSHSIKIVGWGVTEEGSKYWIVQNNWGSTWGEDGYAKIGVGQNDLFFEQFAYSIRVKSDIPSFQQQTVETDVQDSTLELEDEPSAKN